MQNKYKLDCLIGSHPRYPLGGHLVWPFSVQLTPTFTPTGWPLSPDDELAVSISIRVILTCGKAAAIATVKMRVNCGERVKGEDKVE